MWFVVARFYFVSVIFLALTKTFKMKCSWPYFSFKIVGSPPPRPLRRLGPPFCFGKYDFYFIIVIFPALRRPLKWDIRWQHLTNVETRFLFYLSRDHRSHLKMLSYPPPPLGKKHKKAIAEIAPYTEEGYWKPIIISLKNKKVISGGLYYSATCM